jgi:pimeloyl-ACP methyl ester carboxylesterase
VTTRIVSAADGRELAVHEAGASDGLPVIVHHGTPSSGLLYEPWIEDAAASGIRLIGFDRAGYGDSSRLPARDVSSASRPGASPAVARTRSPARRSAATG